MAQSTVPKRHQPHTRYYLDGKRVPGVTTILGVLDKPALKRWANRIGLDGIDLQNYVDDMADVGSCCHYMIECDVKGEEPDLSDYSQNTINLAENGFLKWLEWKNQHNVQPFAGELKLTSRTHRAGGTADIYSVVDRRTALIDVKTSGSGIFPDMEAQAAVYYDMLRENGYDVQDAYILRVGRDESEGFDYKQVTNIDRYLDVFRHCRAIYDLKKELNWR